MPEKSNIAVAVSILSFVVSALSYYRNTGPAQLRREQIARMRIIAAIAVVLWDQINLILKAQVDKIKVDPYLFPSIQENALRLEEGLNDAVGLGLFPIILEDREHTLTMYAAFIQGLRWIASMPDPEKQPLEEWTKMHFLFGMVRLIDVCLRYKPQLLPKNVRPNVEGLEEKAWTYLSNLSIESRSTESS